MRSPDLKCNLRSCYYSVAGKSHHVICNKHRKYNNQGYYDPEKCNICRSMDNQANSNTNLAAGSKCNFSKLLRTMSKTTAF